MYDLISHIESCYVAIPTLLYYSHIPTALIVLLLGIFILWKSKENRLAGKAFFSISIVFFLWVTVEGSIWFLYNSMAMMFLWSLLGLLYLLIHLLSLYFIYVFIDKKDISFNKKLLFGVLSAPIIFLTPTIYNLTGFDILNCQALESNFFVGYRYSIGIITVIWIVSLLISRYIKAGKQLRKQIVLVGLGVLSFLLLFSWSEIAGSLTQNFTITQYGLFGMPVFMAFLVYLIIQYKAFNIKLFTANALVIAIAILIASQYFFIRNPTNRILTGITLGLVVIFGWWLANSVRREIEQKEKLALLAKELEDANDHLKEVDKLKDDFLSMASHELNTPIAAIEGYLSMILVEGLGGQIPDKARKYLESVFKSSQRLANMVKDLLNVSRIESNRIHIIYEEKQIEDVIEQAILEVDSKVREAKHTLTFDKPKHAMPSTWFDVTRITEILINILGNSIKYTEPGGKIKVGCIADGDKIVVSVADNGKGIPKDRQQAVFEKFSQVDVMKDQVKGTGLGMYISQKFIQLHKGKIWFHSDGADKGTTFFFSLPILVKKPHDDHEGEGQVLH